MPVEGTDFPDDVEDPRLTANAGLREAPGTTIGRYRLLQEIGEGGFGVVYLAEQTEPVKRRVALKVLKPGMDTREIVARFAAEQQALALRKTSVGGGPSNSRAKRVPAVTVKRLR